jgi:murein DD-endopeptidase MepM/ murein hydrolase activator NlpD
MAQNTLKKRRFIGKDVILSGLLAGTLILFYNKIISLGEDFDSFETISYQEKTPVYKFGYDINKVKLEAKKIVAGDILTNVLISSEVDMEIVKKLDEKASRVSRSLTRLQAGKYLYFLKSKKCDKPHVCIYEPSPYEYIEYKLDEDPQIKHVRKETYACVDMAAGTIKSTLYNALRDRDISPKMIDKLEDALSSSVDFYHTQVGDEFKLLFERKYIDNKDQGLGKLLGAYYKNKEGEFHAVYYENGRQKGYYDLQGRALREGFLKAPVKNVRISSAFNRSRFHPILQRTIPHLGTDYAAPYGTPIISIADGVVEEAAYRGGNGRYVKIRHDKTYQTQYLHMQAYAKGIKRGARVRQGQTIGYVGSTGLATGPHVCFRFWKNGAQINHRNLRFNQPKPMSNNEIIKYAYSRDRVVNIFNAADEEKGLFASKNISPSRP